VEDLTSAIRASVVSNKEATEAELMRACLTTLVGSRTPASKRPV